MASPSAPTRSASENKEHDEYRAKEDARTLTDAEVIRADAKRMSAAKRHLEHAVRALGKTRDGKRGKRKSGRY